METGQTGTTHNNYTHTKVEREREEREIQTFFFYKQIDRILFRFAEPGQEALVIFLESIEGDHRIIKVGHKRIVQF